MKVKQNIQVLIKMIGIVVISSIVLVGLLCLVYKLPRNRMVEHVIESDNTIRLQNDDYNMSISNFYDTYDTDTNIIISHRTGFQRFIAGCPTVSVRGISGKSVGRLGRYLDELCK